MRSTIENTYLVPRECAGDKLLPRGGKCRTRMDEITHQSCKRDGEYDCSPLPRPPQQQDVQIGQQQERGTLQQRSLVGACCGNRPASCGCPLPPIGVADLVSVPRPLIRRSRSHLSGWRDAPTKAKPRHAENSAAGSAVASACLRCCTSRAASPAAATAACSGATSTSCCLARRCAARRCRATTPQRVRHVANLTVHDNGLHLDARVLDDALGPRCAARQRHELA